MCDLYAGRGQAVGAVVQTGMGGCIMNCILMCLVDVNHQYFNDDVGNWTVVVAPYMWLVAGH